jgi:hypothetical protein
MWAFGLAVLSGVVIAETQYQSISATATSQTVGLRRQSASVMVCNLGANEAYFRLFDGNDEPAAATTANILLPAGTAAAPVCMSYSKSATAPGFYAAIAVVCDTAETATVVLQYE